MITSCPLRCITVRQPWAEAIAAGLKLVENRSRSVRYRGPIGIHAGLRDDPGAWTTKLIMGAAKDLTFGTNGYAAGAIVALADLVDCHPTRSWDPCCQPWGEAGGNVHHLVLANVRRLPAPVLARGSLALPWTAPEDAATQVWDQLATVAT